MIKFPFDLSELARNCSAFLLVQEPAARAADGSDDFMKDSAVLHRWAAAHAVPLRRRGLSLLARQGGWVAGDRPAPFPPQPSAVR